MPELMRRLLPRIGPRMTGSAGMESAATEPTVTRASKTGPRMARPLSALALALLLTACGSEPPPNQIRSYRQPGAPIWSIAGFDPARLQGRWVEVASFLPEGRTCRPGGMEVGRGATGGTAARVTLCRAEGAISRSGALQPAGPGRVSLAGEAEPWWVLWVDADYRTLVIGTPSGRFGHVLNRDGALPADRLKAAREILDWNGYDLSRLRMLR